jgi:hypothetical protein
MTMSTLLGRNSHESPTGSREAPPSVLGAALLAATQAAVASLAVVLAPVVGTWIATAHGSATLAGIARLSVDLWVLAQHGGIVVADGHVGIVPLGLSLVPLTACWFAGRRLARALDPRASSRAAPAFPPLRALIVFIAGYALLAGLAAVLVGTSQARPIPGQVFAGAAVVAGAGGGLGVAGYRFGSARGGLQGALRLLPGRLSAWLRPAAVALGIQLGAAAGLVTGLLLTHRSQVAALHRALQPDAVGGVVLALAQLLLLPNLVLWAAAVIAGPGIAIGAGTSITTSFVELGPLPAFPVLGALPNPGPVPAAVGALLCIPVLAGAVAGVLVVRSTRGLAWWWSVLDGLGTAAVAGVVFTGLAWLSGGPAGPGRLARTGPVAWQAGAAFAIEVAAGALLAVVLVRVLPAAVRRALRRWRGDDTACGDWTWSDRAGEGG